MSGLAFQLVPVVSAAVAVCSLLAYLHFSGRGESHAAREEAMALASVRAEVIVDLRRRLADERSESRGLLLALRDDLTDEPPDVDCALARIDRRLAEQSVPNP